jgi:hypothetical protein
MTLRRPTLPSIGLVVAATASGCAIVDPSLYEALADAGVDMAMPDDGGVDMEPPRDLGRDMGGLVGADTCGDMTAPLLRGSTVIHVDTTDASASFAPGCGAAGTAVGRDRFFRIEVTGGEYWHFHLAPDFNFATASARNPIVYVTQATDGRCDSRVACDSFSNQCSGPSDEHFAFTPSVSGTWFVGVDDANPDGGHYILTVVKPTCRDGTKEHGESCDEPGAPDCTTDCRKIVGSTRMGGFPTESEFNDNLVEANLVAFELAEEVEISGDVGGGGDCYPDVFKIVTRAGGGRIVVEALDAGGTPCSAGASAPYTLQLTDARTPPRILGGDLAGNGCPRVAPQASPLPESTYYLWVRANDPSTMAPTPYRLRISRT